MKSALKCCSQSLFSEHQSQARACLQHTGVPLTAGVRGAGISMKNIHINNSALTVYSEVCSNQKIIGDMIWCSHALTKQACKA